MKRLIVNADDFGMTRGVNRAIIECFQSGSVTSTTLMVNGESAVEAALAAADNPGLGVGLHLNLTSGPPTLPPDRVPSLVGMDGSFPGVRQAVWRLTSGRARSHELEEEIAAQIGRLQQLGIRPTHIDSHHHLHAHPRLRSAIRKTCPRLGVTRMRGFHMKAGGAKSMAIAMAARLPSSGRPMKAPDRFTGIDTMGGQDPSAPIQRELARRGDVLEFMCHPGYADQDLERATSYNKPREAELRSLLSEGFAAAIQEAGAQRVSFAAL